MGPSSIAALNAIKAGEDINVAGIYGTTCGGIMRSPSAFFMSSEKNLEENTVKCLLPTHNTKCAMEAALSYNYALLAASQDKDFDSILDYADVLDTFAYRYGLKNGMYSFGTAVGLFKSVVSFVLVMGANQISKKYNESALF